ncbi:unnamed protein product [Arabidopsis thaliana]|uniref:(thale cress) hypothetical protein n=1 Tax=Arabidopsis thaliana TaxID=3702 RepID=A0A7G2E892_ARATH|nr:unnamed protein product [Arabidopsis thaliana]
MSIEEEEDAPLINSDQPNFFSTERNLNSIMGRFLNPDKQRMSKWILDMPRIWRLYDRVRGIALSRDRFQFIFKYEEDLQEVLKTGVWTQDDWGVVMETTIKSIAKCVGQVIEFPFDENEAQSKDYVRIRILFDVSKGLRNSKEIQLPNGSMVKIGIDYERIRKRCFQCQRLTHEKPRCPYLPSVASIPVENHFSELIFASDKDNNSVPLVEKNQTPVCPPPKLMADAMKASVSQPLVQNSESLCMDGVPDNPFVGLPSDFCSGSLEASSSISFTNDTSTCKRPRSWIRNTKDRKGKNRKIMSESLENKSDLNRNSLEKGKAFPWTLWHIWKNRNSLLFNGFHLPSHLLIQKAWDDTKDWKIGINKLGDLQVTTFWGYAATISRKEDMMIYTGRSQQMQKLDALRSCPILLIGTMLLLRTL